MRYEAGNDKQGRGRDAEAPHRVPTPSERGEEAEPDALHDPVQAEQRRTVRDFGVTGAGASDEVGPLRQPPGAQGQDAGAHGVPGTPATATPGRAEGPDGRPDPRLSEQERGVGRGAGGQGADAGRGLGGEPGIGNDPGVHHGTGVAGDRAGAGRPGGERTGLTGAGTAGAGRTEAGHLPQGATAGPSAAQLLPHGERDKLGLRLQQAVNQFVDEPRRAVEEADHVLEEATRHVADTLAEHRRSLRSAWESKDRDTETEELRVALRKYREVTERLLQM
ncbi:hypothetical protein [Streptomyces sp. NPDC051561]|uniref:hypothetical protein n=1 Tax=Streptomyces sp. NPDC051561 TaxID=3365658 RepID=UPI0037AC7010